MLIVIRKATIPVYFIFEDKAFREKNRRQHEFIMFRLLTISSNGKGLSLTQGRVFEKSGHTRFSTFLLKAKEQAGKAIPC